MSVAQQILRYLDEHPNAKDTLEGIMSWWLAEHPTVSEVKAGLDELVVHGSVIVDFGPDGRVYYRANLER